MAEKAPTDPTTSIPSAEQLRMKLLEEQMKEMERQDKGRESAQKELAAFTDIVRAIYDSAVADATPRVRWCVARLRGAVSGAQRSDRGRPLTLERDEMMTLTRDIVGSGGALHVRAPGGSMRPTIPRGALVRIGPVRSGIRPGNVVLALTADGEPYCIASSAVAGWYRRDTPGDAADHDGSARAVRARDRRRQRTCAKTEPERASDVVHRARSRCRRSRCAGASPDGAS